MRPVTDVYKWKHNKEVVVNCPRVLSFENAERVWLNVLLVGEFSFGPHFSNMVLCMYIYNEQYILMIYTVH